VYVLILRVLLKILYCHIYQTVSYTPLHTAYSAFPDFDYHDSFITCLSLSHPFPPTHATVSILLQWIWIRIQFLFRRAQNRME